MPDLKPGATGRFPQGKLKEDDEGELAVGLAVLNGKLILNFGKSIGWIGMSKQEAEVFANALLEKARTL